MNHKPFLLELARLFWHAVEPFVPGALGALVAQMIRPGLGLVQRAIQWAVSVIVFHFVTQALGAIFAWPHAVIQAIGFFVGFLAFEALHAWQKAAVAAGVSIIGLIPVLFERAGVSWFVKPGATPQPPASPEGE